MDEYDFVENRYIMCEFQLNFLKCSFIKEAPQYVPMLKQIENSIPWERFIPATRKERILWMELYVTLVLDLIEKFDLTSLLWVSDLKKEIKNLQTQMKYLNIW